MNPKTKVKKDDEFTVNQELTDQANNPASSKEASERLSNVLNEKIEEAKESPEVTKALLDVKDWRLRDMQGKKAQTQAIMLLRAGKVKGADIDQTIKALALSYNLFNSICRQVHAKIQEGESLSKQEKLLFGGSTAVTYAKATLSKIKSTVATLIKYSNADTAVIAEKDVDTSFLDI